MPTAAELVALVDAEGRVVGAERRCVVRRRNLRHGATAVLVRSPDGRIYLHRRAPHKDWAPSHYDAAAGGVLRAGEDPAACAARELAEELGVEGAPLRSLGLSAYDDPTVSVVEHVFDTVWDGVIRFADDEVVWGAWVGLSGLGRLMADPTWPFVPDTRALLTRLATAGVGDYGRLIEPPAAP